MDIVSSTVDPLLNETQAAAYLNVRPQTLATWRCTRRYGLPYLKIGRKVGYRRSDLDRWLEARTVRHTGESADRG